MNLMARASRVLPGGVSSPVRAFRGVGGQPVFVKAAEGAYLYSEDGRRFIDYIGSYGPMIHGHRHPDVEKAVEEALRRSTTFGAPTVGEVELGELICSAFPAMDMVRFVSSGTEATMSALRLARAATGRDKFIKFVGCYHGHGDAFLVAAGSGAATLGVPSSPGVPEAVTAHTLVAPFNDLDAVRKLFEEHDDIAAIFVEPIGGNMGLVPPADGFLEGLREVTEKNGALLVFDEVMTGFRVAWGGAQILFDVEPDLTTLGKVIGGGLPIGAYGGRRELMEQIAPAGPVYQAGTLSGNPLAVAAGRASLKLLKADGGAAYDQLEATSNTLSQGLQDAAASHNVPLRIQRQGSMVGLFFTDSTVVSQDDVDASDRELFGRVFHRLLAQGVHLPPSAYETWFVSTAHGEAEVTKTINAFAGALAEG